MNYTLKDESTIATKKMVKKFSERKFTDSSYIRGKFIIKNWRKYQYRDEVDIEFIGEIYAKLVIQSDWLKSDILTNKKHSVSKIKINRFIRKKLFFEVKTYLAYFSIDLKSYNNIVKIKWI